MTGPQLAGMVSGIAMIIILVIAGAMCRRSGTGAVAPPPAPAAVSAAAADSARSDSAGRPAKSRRRHAKNKAPRIVKPEARNYLDETVTRRRDHAVAETDTLAQ